MRYQTQDDIDFSKLSEFVERIEDKEPKEISEIAMEIFYDSKEVDAVKLLELEDAMKKVAAFRYKLDFNVLKKAEKFIDADMFLLDGNKLELAKLIVKPKLPWQKVNFSLSTVNHAEAAFIDWAEEIKERHPWIYNPPILPTKAGAEQSMAAEYMKDFEKDYGGYMELTYLLTKGDFTKAKKVWKWPTDKFLFMGEYLLRKKRIEAI